MYYYSIAIIGSKVQNLIYHYSFEISPLSEVYITLINKKVRGYILARVDKPTFNTISIIEVLKTKLLPIQKDFSNFIRKYYCSTEGESLALFHPYKIEKSLELQLEIDSGVTLSSIQQEALAFIKREKISLLFADTASGKTEIYIEYIASVISSGKNALLLMPEISLTPQIEKRLARIFGDRVVLWHSKLTKKQKNNTLLKINSSKGLVVLGARSALFLPLDNIGVVIVDEEHDNSYKSGSKPRYNGRDLAIYLAGLHGCNIVLGSATPSLNSYVKFNHYRIRGAYTKSNKDYIFSDNYKDDLIKKLVDVKRSGGQSLVFVPTKANFKLLKCKDCGHVMSCPFCTVSLSLYLNKRAMVCNYCNYTQKIEDKCSECSGIYTLNVEGTAEISSYIVSNSNLKVLLFDREHITTFKKLKSSLDSFNRGEYDVIVGTQMLSKGHDYSNIKLSVIVGIDNLLSIPSYSTREDAMSLFLQVSGRSGRSGDSRVLVYSKNSDFFSRYSVDYEEFLKDEAIYRESLFPPFKKLMRIIVSNKDNSKAKEILEHCSSEIDQSNVTILSVGEAPILKISNKYRYEILLRGDKSTDLINSVKGLKYYDSSYVIIDNDPLDLS